MSKQQRKWSCAVLKNGGKYVAFDYGRNPVYYLTDDFKEAMVFMGEDEQDAVWDVCGDASGVLGSKCEIEYLNVVVTIKEKEHD